jgi:hypothetical protein
LREELRRAAANDVRSNRRASHDYDHDDDNTDDEEGVIDLDEMEQNDDDTNNDDGEDLE